MVFWGVKVGLTHEETNDLCFENYHVKLVEGDVKQRHEAV